MLLKELVGTNKTITGLLDSTLVMIEKVDVVGAELLVKFFDGKTVTSKMLSQTTIIRPVNNKAIAQARDKYYLNNLTSSLGYSGKIGSDPEMFVEDEHGEVVPAFNFLKAKTTIDEIPYWDGFQAEFSTVANTCLAYHVDSIRNGIYNLYQAALKHNPKAQLSIQTTMSVPNNVLKSAEEKHVQFGCMPSFNAYGMEGIKLNGRDVPFRSAGGHIHFGIGIQTHESAAPMVKALDAVLGVACVSLFADYDSPRRRSMYGLAGEYRLPSHGMEYRTLSNAWMCHPMITHAVFDLSRKALMLGRSGLLHFYKGDEAEIIRIINTCDVAAARSMIENNKDLYLTLFKSCYGNGDMTPLYRMFLDGVSSVVEKPGDLVSNWDLKGTWKTHSNNANVQVCANITNLLLNKRVG